MQSATEEEEVGMSVNKCFLVGFVGRDPELRYTQQGKALCKFSVATVEKWAGNERTTWHEITCWGGQAEWASQNVRKGSEVYIEGSISVRVWEDKDGRKRKDVGVTARDLKLVGKSANGDAERRADKYEGDTDADVGRDEKKDDEDVDLPF